MPGAPLALRACARVIPPPPPPVPSLPHSVAAWAAAASVERLPPEAAAWPPLLLEHLQLAGTRVTPAGAGELERLPRLRCAALRCVAAGRTLGRLMCGFEAGRRREMGGLCAV